MSRYQAYALGACLLPASQRMVLGVAVQKPCRVVGLLIEQRRELDAWAHSVLAVAADARAEASYLNRLVDGDRYRALIAQARTIEDSVSDDFTWGRASDIVVESLRAGVYLLMHGPHGAGVVSDAFGDPEASGRLMVQSRATTPGERVAVEIRNDCVFVREVRGSVFVEETLGLGRD